MSLKSFSNFLTLLLALAGCVVSIVLTVEKLNPVADIGCRRFGGNCEKTINSDYGHVGRVPTSLFGLGMYLTVAGICVARLKLLRDRRAAEAVRADTYAMALEREEETVTEQEHAATPAVDPTLRLRRQIKLLDAGLWVIAALAIITSWYLQYVSLWVINCFCPWCFASASLVTIIFGLATYDFLLEGRKLDGEQKLLAWISGFIIVCFACVLAPVVNTRIRETRLLCTPPLPGPSYVAPSKRALILTKYLVWKGDPGAKYALVEFADYQCPHCKKASAEVEKLLKTPPNGPVRFAFRNFPLDPQTHPWARPAALAAEAAGEQGKFWEMHDFIFARQDDFKDPMFSYTRFADWAKQIGLDVPRFKKDLESKKISDRVVDDHIAGESTDLQLTPSFYLVTPTQVTMLSGIDALEEVWSNPRNKAWK